MPWLSFRVLDLGLGVAGSSFSRGTAWSICVLEQKKLSSVELLKTMTVGCFVTFIALFS